MFSLISRLYKKNPVFRFCVVLLMLIGLSFIVPAVKHTIFPSMMTRVERVLLNASFKNCSVHVERERRTKILLAVKYNGTPSITTEIYRMTFQELDCSSPGRCFFAHSINKNPDESFYLTETRMRTDPDLKTLERLEVKYCARLINKEGRVRFKGHEPVIQCAVPIRKITCKRSE